MRRLHLGILCVLLSTSLFPISSGTPTDAGFEINLNDANYTDGTLSTDKGGIVTGKHFFLQAKNIVYTRRLDVEPKEHTLEASDQLFITHKGKPYRGSRAKINLETDEITIWDGCTKSDRFYMGGETIVLHKDGSGEISKAYITTSENESNDWAGESTAVHLKKNSTLSAKNVVFYCESLPIFYSPTIKTSLSSEDGGTPFRYRLRWGGSEGLRVGISYIFHSEHWRNRTLLDYSMKFGLGGGLRSAYKSSTSPARFDCLNYVAQGEHRSFSSYRYRCQGFYTNSIEPYDIKIKAMYDKLSDNKMKYDFSEHAISDARAGLTQLTVSKGTENWKTAINTRTKINSFQTTKQELPLCTFVSRSQPIGKTPLILENDVSAGYLSYRYAKHTPHVHNFASTRNEIAQKLYTNFTLFPFVFSPSIGYRVIQYSNSPQHHDRLQALGELSLEMSTRLINSSLMGKQIVEPYVEWKTYTRPPIQTRRVFIFDTEDGWAQMNYAKYGFRHSWYLPFKNSDFQPKILTDIFAYSFFKTRYLSRNPYKLWLASTFDAYPTVSYYLNGGWDFKRQILDHLNVAMRKTISQNLALILQWRQRSAYSWRKIDSQNFMVEAVRSPRRMRHSQMSDNRKTAIATLAYSPTPVFDTEFSIFYGIRKKHPKRYVNYELTLGAMLGGGLRVSLTYQYRPGGPTNGVYVSFDLGPKSKTDDISFRKIGDGNYDIS